MSREEIVASIEREFEASGFPAAYEGMEVTEEKVEGGDGLRLRTVCCLPKAPAPVAGWPVIFVRSCYPQSDFYYRAQAEGFCARGFAYVYQYCRGTGGSEGEFEPNIHERADGAAALAWLCAQPWAGRIGIFGCSYLALTGWAVADILPEKVKTLYLTHYGTDRFTSAYQDGLFRHDVLTSWAMGNSGCAENADYLASCRYRPHVGADEKLWGKKLDWYRSWVTATDRADDYWQTGFWKLLRDIPSRVKVPVYMAEGWYDHHLGSALHTYQSLSAQCRAQSVFEIGAWNHSFQVCLSDRKTDHADNSDLRHALKWFTAVLKNGETPKGRLRTYVVGADEWREWGGLRLDAPERASFYLAGGPADDGAYPLTRTPSSAQEDCLRYDYDPENPVISHGCESMLRSMQENGSLLQPGCGWRGDVLSFVSAPLREPLTVAGSVSVRLCVSSTAADTAFTAKLMEVFPDGSAYNLRSGITTLAYRGHSDRRQTYRPGEIVTAAIDMWDVVCRFHAGSRIRLDVTSSDFPEYCVHPNLPGVWSLQTQTRVATQTIFCSKDHPSVLTLPVCRE